MSLNPDQFQLDLGTTASGPKHPGDMSPEQWMRRPDVAYHGVTEESLSQHMYGMPRDQQAVSGLYTSPTHFRHYGTELTARDRLKAGGGPDPHQALPSESAIYAFRIPNLLDVAGNRKNISGFPEGFPHERAGRANRRNALDASFMAHNAEISDAQANVAGGLASIYSDEQIEAEDRGDPNWDVVRGMKEEAGDILPTSLIPAAYENDPWNPDAGPPHKEFPGLDIVASENMTFGYDPYTMDEGDYEEAREDDEAMVASGVNFPQGTQGLNVNVQDLMRDTRTLLRGNPLSYINAYEGESSAGRSIAERNIRYSPGFTSTIMRSDLPRSYAQDVADSPNRPEPVRQWARDVVSKHSKPHGPDVGSYVYARGAHDPDKVPTTESWQQQILPGT